MQKIKEYNYIINNEPNNNIFIRSIKNNDLSFYKNWFKDGHILKDTVNAVTEEEIEKWLLRETKTHYIFIVELNKNPCGEIVLWNDPALIIMDKNYKKPIFSITVKFYENINENEINDILKIFLEKIKQIKIGTFYVLIDDNDERNYLDNYLQNGFKYINKELYKTKLEKQFIKMNIDNPFNKLRMLIKII
jgi:hypothetical protein